MKLYIINNTYRDFEGDIVRKSGRGFEIVKTTRNNRAGDGYLFWPECLTEIPEELQNEPIEVIKLWAAL